MITWTITGTVPFLTAETASSGQTTNSGLFSASSDGFIVSESGATLISLSSLVQHGAGSTTFLTEASSFTSAGGASVTFTTETSDPYATGTASSTNSAGASSQYSRTTSTTSAETRNVNTSTTATTAESFYSTRTSSFTTANWTTSNRQVSVSTTNPLVTLTINDLTRTTCDFYKQTGTSTASRLSSFATSRSKTVDVTTTLTQKVSITAREATVIQAANNEVLYVITSSFADISGYSAAAEMAQSQARFTLSPSVATVQMATANISRPTSEVGSVLATEELTVSRSALAATTYTIPVYDRFPPSTFSAIGATGTVQASTSTRTTSSQDALTYGGLTNTVTRPVYLTNPSTITNQRASLTFQDVIFKTLSFAEKTTVYAARTESFSSSDSNSTILLGYQSYTNQGGSTSSLAVAGNTVLPALQATTLLADNARQYKYGTVGAMVSTSAGGWITAGSSFPTTINASDFYVSVGRQGQAVILLPQTNASRTVAMDSITWTQSTTADSSVEGATSKPTTASASFGVAGATSAAEFGVTAFFSLAQNIGGWINHFAGAVKEGETFVQMGNGIYKNRANGQTTSFDGNVTARTQAATAPATFWVPQRNIAPANAATVVLPVTWSELRNTDGYAPGLSSRDDFTTQRAFTSASSTFGSVLI